MTDPAGIFTSDVHRHIIGHLSHPDDSYGWTTDGLINRTKYDPVLWFTTPQEIEPYLQELVEDGDVQRTGEAWQMTPQGFAKLTGPIKDEPGPEAARPQPQLVQIDLIPRDPGRVEFDQAKPAKKKLFGRSK